jgi:hypothetical protein
VHATAATDAGAPAQRPGQVARCERVRVEYAERRCPRIARAAGLHLRRCTICRAVNFCSTYSTRSGSPRRLCIRIRFPCAYACPTSYSVNHAHRRCICRSTCPSPSFVNCRLAACSIVHPCISINTCSPETLRRRTAHASRSPACLTLSPAKLEPNTNSTIVRCKLMSTEVPRVCHHYSCQAVIHMISTLLSLLATIRQQPSKKRHPGNSPVTASPAVPLIAKDLASAV